MATITTLLLICLVAICTQAHPPMWGGHQGWGGHHGNQGFGGHQGHQGNQDDGNNQGSGSVAKPKTRHVYYIKRSLHGAHPPKVWGQKWENGVAKNISVTPQVANSLVSYMDSVRSLIGSLFGVKGGLKPTTDGRNTDIDKARIDQGGYDANNKDKHANTLPPTPATTTTTVAPYLDFNGKIAAVWDHIKHTTQAREFVQNEALSAILILAEKAQLLCVDKSVHVPTGEDDVVFLCKDQAKARFSGAKDIMDRQNFVESVNGF